MPERTEHAVVIAGRGPTGPGLRALVLTGMLITQPTLILVY